MRSSLRRGASTRGDFATTSLRQMDRLSPGKRKEAFQADCARLWGNAYDYSKAQYKDNHSHILIVCPKHGLFRTVFDIIPKIILD